MSDPITAIQKQYRKLVYTAIGTAACLLFGLLSLMFEVLIGVTLIVAAVVLYFTLYRPTHRSYSDIVNETNLERTICRLIDSPTPQPVGGDIITEKMLKDSELLPEGPGNSDPLFCWEMKGHRKGFSISLADTTMMLKFTNSNGRSSYHTNSGVFTIFDLPSDSYRYFLVMDRMFLPDMIREMYMNTKPQYTAEFIGDQELDERYFLYRCSKDTGEALPISFLQSLKRLMNYTPGLVAINVKGPKMYTFINSRFVSQDVSLTNSITQKDLDTDQFPELSYLINIAAALGGGSAKAESDDETDEDPDQGEYYGPEQEPDTNGEEEE